MKTIGFIDYYMSEWHANNYPAWMGEIIEKNGLDVKIAYAYAELDVSPLDGVTTDQWCEKNGVTKCNTMEELCEKSDYILILSPTNPEKHLPYARVALPYGKPTYIDKTFAPNAKEAAEIFALAEKYHTPFFSTSALRYADELADFQNVKNLIITGGGRTIDEYIVHQVEMLVNIFKGKVVTAKAERQGKHSVCMLETDNGEAATLVHAHRLPFSLCAQMMDDTPLYKPVTSDYFKKLMADILRFYREGTVSYDIEQLKEVMRVRDGILAAWAEPGKVIDLK